MDITSIGGEFKLLNRIIQLESGSDILVPNGDDAAVIKVGEELLAISTDTFVEERHFSFDYYHPKQVGKKAVEASASDIVAMGGKPTHYLVNITVGPKEEVERLEQLFAGMYEAGKRINALMLGGDTTAGSEMVISVAVLGRIEGGEKNICRRSDAQVGDIIYVSGSLGRAALGLELLRRGIKDYDTLKRAHLEPHCRIDLVEELAPHAHAMIDISDGLSSELHHISAASKCGMLIDEALIPISREFSEASKLVSCEPLDLVFGGGEDYELLFTASPETKVPGLKIGEVVAERGVWLKSGGKVLELKNSGYEHF